MLFLSYLCVLSFGCSWQVASTSSSDCLDRLVSEMTYNMLMGMLNPTNSPTHYCDVMFVVMPSVNRNCSCLLISSRCTCLCAHYTCRSQCLHVNCVQWLRMMSGPSNTHVTNSLQCFHTLGWVTGTASECKQNLAPAIRKGSSLVDLRGRGRVSSLTTTELRASHDVTLERKMLFLVSACGCWLASG